MRPRARTTPMRELGREPRLGAGASAGRGDNGWRSPAAAPGEGAGFKLGSRVRHARFGDGVVLNLEGQGPHARVHVNFEHQGAKWLMLSYANLEVVKS